MVYLDGDVAVTSIVTPDAELDRRPQGAVQDITNIIPDSLNGVTIHDVANSVLGIVQLTSFVVFAHSGGLVVVSKATRQVHSFVTFSNVTCIGYLPGWIYFGTSDTGVHRMLESSLLTEGDRSAFTALKYSTGTTPSISSNNILAIDGSGVSLVIATDSSLEYIPDHGVATIHTMSQAGVTDCAVSATTLAYIVSGLAYAIALPTGNWSLSAADLSGLKSIGASVAKIYTTEITGDWASIAGAAGDYIVSGTSGNTKWLYSIDPTTKNLTLVDTFTSTWTEGSSPHAQVRGDYIFSYGKTGERKLIVMKIVGNAITEIYVQATSSWPSDTSAETLIVNEAGTVALYPRGDAGTYQTVEPPPRYSVEYWYLHNRSGDTVTGPFVREFPNDLSILGITPNGAYLVGLTLGGTPAGGKGSVYGIGFCSMSTGLAVSITVGHRSNPLSAVFVTDSYMVTKERVDVGGVFHYYMVLYSVSGSVINYRDEVYLGPLSDSFTDVYRDFVLFSYDNQLFLDIRHSNWIAAGVYAESELRQYEVVNNKLELMVTSIDTGETTDRSAWLGPFGSVSNGWSLARVEDYDLANQTSLGTLITLHEIDFATTEKAYVTANTVEAAVDTFIVTSDGLLIEDRTAKTAPRLVLDKLQPIPNVIALEPSDLADRATGVVAYATSDGTDGFAGVIDLEA
jgi:hypothetical protein